MMTGNGQFGSIDMGGMFTVVKVRRHHQLRRSGSVQESAGTSAQGADDSDKKKRREPEHQEMQMHHLAVPIDAGVGDLCDRGRGRRLAAGERCGMLLRGGISAGLIHRRSKRPLALKARGSVLCLRATFASAMALYWRGRQIVELDDRVGLRPHAELPASRVESCASMTFVA